MEFKEHLLKYLSKEEIDKLVDSFSNKEIKGVLVNPLKMNVELFKSNFPHVKNHPLIPYAFIYNKDEYNLGSHIFHELGAYYIQDPSAMLVSYFLDPKKDDIVLDMCAAPGGKTIGAAIRMENEGVLISNDISYSRLNTLISNVERLGIKNNVVISTDFSKCYKNYPNYFDKIILDAPCSGSGMFRKLEAMKDDWTYEKVLKNSIIQKELILAAYYMLKEGGDLIYSTCSYSYEEDEEVISYLRNNTDAEIIKLPHVEGEYRSKELPEAIHLFSSHFLGEGHFMCLVHKSGHRKPNKFEEKIIEKTTTSKGGNKEILRYKINAEIHKSFVEKEIRPGLFISTLIGKKEIPSHAYSHTLKDDKNMFEVSLDEAKKLILGETINIKKNDGYCYPSYLGLPLGVIHVVNNNVKNLYPKGLRKKII